MKMFRKTVSLILAGVLTLGIAGCDLSGSKQEKGNVDDVIQSYGKALQKLDEEKILGMTTWDESDSEYSDFKDCFVFDANAEYIWEVYTATAGTIELNYKDTAIKVKGDKASVDVTYLIVDWKTLYKEQYFSADDLVKAIKDSMNVITTDGSIEFTKDGNDWKISKITKLDELMEFGRTWPNLESKQWPTMPTDDTEPTDEPTFPTGTQYADSYQKAIAAYLKVLDDNRAAITAVQETYRIDPVGIYDIDGNGIPELYFLATTGDSPVMNSSLFIYSYNENAGEALKQIEVPDIIYMAGSGGLYQIYATSNRLIITHAGGEDSDFKYWTEIYNFQWDLIASYRRNCLYDYNAPEDQASTIKYYEEDVEITEEQYNKVFKEDANNTVIVLAKNYTPSSGDVEYPLVSKPSFTMLAYENAYTYLESLKN